jgi:eukaryotic-like serine/threonine-protein kinase
MSTPTTAIPGSPDLEGQTVGEYVVEGRLGRGAFGTVYKGVHPLIGKAVAIKVLSQRFSADPEMVSRFVAEARAVNQIRHRHIIDIFSFGQLADGRHYYVMEYLEGETLQALLERERRIPLARCLPILRAIGRALDAAHTHGIAHRDLKAENIFLGIDSDGGVWPKLLDFGIAKLINPEDGLTHKTRSGMSIGTPLYMSPEQCHGRQIDHRTDIYAFGILVYLMLTGGFPFDGDSYMEILMKQVGSPATPPSAHVAELPEAIDDVVLWLVHKDPALRPPDLRTAVTALEQAAERAGLLALAAPTGGWGVTSDAMATQPAAIVVPRSAADASRHAGKMPIVAVASLVAIMGIVAAAVALYPRAEGAATVLVTRRAEPSAALGPGRGPLQLSGTGSGRSPGQAPGQDGHPPRQAPEAVIVTVNGVPSGTAVVAGGRHVGVAPGPVQLPYGAGPLALTFQASGYLPAAIAIVPDRDRSLSLRLARQPAARGGKRTTKDDIIPVFGGDPP